VLTADRPRSPPGPRGHWLLGNTREFVRDPLQALVKHWRCHGDVVRFRFAGGLSAHLLAHPDHVKHVLQDRHRDYPKAPRMNRKLRPLLGEGLFTSGGALWLRQRRLSQPAFHRQRLAVLATLTTDATAAMLDRWQEGARRQQPIRLMPEMSRLTLTVLGQALFGAHLDEEGAPIARAVQTAFEYTNRRLESYVDLPEWLPLPSTRRFLRARRTLDTRVHEIVRERLRSGSGGDDLLALLLAARDADSSGALSERQLRDELVTMLVSGHETTAAALTWILYLVATHADVARRLRAELDAVLGARAPTLEELPRLPYTAMVIQEALRLYPPLWGITRQPVTEDEIDGYRVPRRTMVILCPYITHRHPEFWDDPEAFDPERFTAERAAARPRYAYFPFGGGPRQCIGDTFALVQAQLVVATLLRQCRLDVVGGYPAAPHPTITLRPRGEILVAVTPS